MANGGTGRRGLPEDVKALTARLHDLRHWKERLLGELSAVARKGARLERAQADLMRRIQETTDKCHDRLRRVREDAAESVARLAELSKSREDEDEAEAIREVLAGWLDEVTPAATQSVGQGKTEG